MRKVLDYIVYGLAIITAVVASFTLIFFAWIPLGILDIIDTILVVFVLIIGASVVLSILLGP